MVELANNDNIDQVLLELKEYASEVDVDFVRKSVRAIGRAAIKLPQGLYRRSTSVLYYRCTSLCVCFDRFGEDKDITCRTGVCHRHEGHIQSISK